jgi:hypothetical protein
MRTQNNERKGLVLVAALAIGIAVVSLLDLHAASLDEGSYPGIIRSQVTNWLTPRGGTSLVEHALRSSAPQQNAASDWVAILPILFAGMISPLALMPRRLGTYDSLVTAAPALPSLFQRPPPFRCS